MINGTVVVFVKAPRAGAVKTRLGCQIGMGRAAALFRIMTARTIAEVQKSSWQVVLAVDPPSSIAGWEPLWPPNLPRVAQGGGNLGMRMKRAFTSVSNGPVVIIGSDAPGLRARHIRSAFRALLGCDAVFGPAKDGGYWLIGLSNRRPAPAMFTGVRWSTQHALADTRKNLPKKFRVGELEMLGDIDEKQDLGAIRPYALAR